MANAKVVTDSGLIRYTITEDETINLGDADGHRAASWIIYITGGGSYSIQPRKKIRGSSIADASAPTTYYFNHSTGASVAATAITGATLIRVPADGCAVILGVDWTSGACQIECLPIMD